VEIEQTTEQQLLAQAEKQTKALENLNVLAQVWSVLAAIGLVLVVVWLIAAANS
jgi:flagellar biogenesis protein FliO